MSEQEQPELYDFRRPTTLPREHARILDTHLTSFARQVATQLSNRFGNEKITASTSDLRINTYDRWISSLPTSTVMVLVGFEQIESHAVFRVDESTAMSWISQMIGGQQVKPGTVTSRKFSQTDIALIQDMVHGFLEDLVYSLGSFIDPQMSVASTFFSPQMAQAAKPNDLMVCLELNFDDGHLMSLAIPAKAILPHMGNANPTSTDEEMDAGLKENIGNVPVEVSLQLSGRKMLTSEILRWEEGTEILLPHPKQFPMKVMVGKQLVGKALRSSRGLTASMKITTNEEGH